MFEKNILKGFIDTHIHTSPDVKPRLLDDYEAALEAKEKGMKAIVLKSHLEPTSGRAYIAHRLTGCSVFGGVTLNLPVGGLNVEAVRNTALMGGKIVWLPTIHHQQIEINQNHIEDILNIIAMNNMVLGTGHLNPQEIFHILDEAHSCGVKKIIVNHPLTRVVGASLEEQKEMARYAYLEHCWVATMPQHDKLNPQFVFEAIEEVGAKHCILATDFGQKHTPRPVVGMEMMIKNLVNQGISWKEIQLMCQDNPEKLLL